MPVTRSSPEPSLELALRADLTPTRHKRRFGRPTKCMCGESARVGRAR